MRLSIKTIAILTASTAALSACHVIPKPVEAPVVQAPVAVQVPTAPLCYEVSALQRVEIPADTKTVVGISYIDNEPYEPLEQRTSQDIIIKQAEVFYVIIDPQTGNQTEITNFCDATVEIGPVGPGLGETMGAPTTG